MATCVSHGNKICSCNKKNSNVRYCCNNCNKRFFRDDNLKLIGIMSEIKGKIYPKPISVLRTNDEENRYKYYNYNASFHKGLQHNLIDGRLVSSLHYEDLKNAITACKQTELSLVPLAPNSQIKLVDPSASCASVLMGIPQGSVSFGKAPSLSSKSGAADMLEVYAMILARDVPFKNYATDPIISLLLESTHLNNSSVLSNLRYLPSTPLIAETIFRGNEYGKNFGPYISQLLLLNIVAGALKIPQLYHVPPTRIEAQQQQVRNEWGITLLETINIQNGNLPPPSTIQYVPRYLYSGRALAEAVHNDPAYQFFYHAALILSSLGAKLNPGWSKFSNQSNFITGSGPASIQCVVADIAVYALKHAWYWKWQHSRKCRPEVYALWVHDVKSGLVENKNNFDLSSIVLENEILKDIFDLNNSWIPNANSYTALLSYREGSPLHPTFPSGHSVIAGACVTILKMYFDGTQPWLSLPGVINGSLGGIAGSLVQANDDGTALIAYNGDAELITINTELNKLASNIGFGRVFSAIHYRSDHIEGMKLGETVAIHYMQDILSTMIENNAGKCKSPEISFRKFDGTITTIKATVCY